MNLKTRTKLILMATIPTLALLYFSVSGTLEKASLATEMVKLESLVDVSVKIGALAHELQKERGMSAAFIGSKDAKFAAELPAQRAETDKKIESLHATLKNFDPSLYSNGLKGILDTATGNLGEIGAKRSAISSFNLEGAESAAYYTKTISAFLDIPSQVSTLSSHSEISRLASSYSSLLQAKERAGRERALLATVFTADKFTPDTLSRFLKNSSAQDVYTDVFFAYALDSQKEYYKAKVSGQAADEVARMKKNATDKANESGLGVDSAYWFKMATERINLLKEVEDKLSGDLLGAADKLKGDAQRMMTFFIVLTVLSILATVVFAYFLTRNILRQLGGEPEHAAEITRNIAAGKLDNQIALQAGDTASLLASMKSMQEQLLARITADKKIADENARIRIALDNVSANVMIADNDCNIIYLNPAVMGMLKNAEADIRKQLPDFSTESLRQPGHHADGRGDPAERGAGRRSRGRRRIAGRTGAEPVAVSQRVQAGQHRQSCSGFPPARRPDQSSRGAAPCRHAGQVRTQAGQGCRQ